MDDGQIIKGLDVLDLMKFIKSKNKRYQAIALQSLEEIIPDKKSDEFIYIRKLLLDTLNNYTRAIFRIIFGVDLEI
ncbi:MAG: hypothetical protein GYA36_18365 [Veillonellaceae bacterium]|nr:hypothetical protein [Veillonellaceae bacterium]